MRSYSDLIQLYQDLTNNIHSGASDIFGSTQTGIAVIGTVSSTITAASIVAVSLESS